MAPTAVDGAALYELAARLYPLPRSLTGDGVRRTLALVSRVGAARADRGGVRGRPCTTGSCRRSGTSAAAWIDDDAGARVVDASASALHVVGYSEPVQHAASGAELLERLHSLPDEPERVPYRTSYYERDWGFCVADRVRRRSTPAVSTRS